jgi:hypothetical protein
VTNLTIIIKESDARWHQDEFDLSPETWDNDREFVLRNIGDSIDAAFEDIG